MRQHILVVHDQPDILRLAQVNFERAGHRVTPTLSPSQALSHLQQEQLDLIIVAGAVSDTGGAKLLAQLRQDPTLEARPSFLHASHRQEGMIAFVRKKPDVQNDNPPTQAKSSHCPHKLLGWLTYKRDQT